MILVYSDNTYLHIGVEALMNNTVFIHTNTLNFDRVVERHLSSVSVVLIDLKSMISTWFEFFRKISHNDQHKFIFYGDDNVFFHLAHSNQFFSKSLTTNHFTERINLYRKGKVTTKRFKISLLTDREWQILSYSLSGMNVSTIAIINNISVQTAYHHQLSACKKLGVRNIARLAQIWNGQLPNLHV